MQTANHRGYDEHAPGERPRRDRDKLRWVDLDEVRALPHVEPRIPLPQSAVRAARERDRSGLGQAGDLHRVRWYEVEAHEGVLPHEESQRDGAEPMTQILKGCSPSGGHFDGCFCGFRVKEREVCDRVRAEVNALPIEQVRLMAVRYMPSARTAAESEVREFWILWRLAGE